MKRVLFAAAFAAVAGMGAAHAADLAARPYTKAPAAAAVESWTGFYLGADVGARWSDTTWTSTALEDPVWAGGSSLLLQGNPASFNSTSFRGGGYAGYNWQVAPSWVIGIEGDVAWADNNKTLAGVPGTWGSSTPASLIAIDSTTVKLGWDASIRGRVGWLVAPSVMLFGTGGIAWQDVSLTANCMRTGPWCILDRTETFHKVATGWTVGGGIEAKVWSNWLARAEYRYADFGHVDHEFFPQTVDSVFMNQSLKTHAVSVGLAYQFGGPVVAKY
ncbi:outer membrane protein [Bradyrhizobium sp. CCGUVB23]|uniref:outer membrane protein n=1 Tax=Bradyrhizobium sp. CCGUVB23 TaxID=2949630 RepID=UPI0020B1B028|nr:outer membrane beta-barrel protein [Bradyrhizobium sp. CCGUVB23]MCP3462516.1 outer membrane beta-barrel protein [Bradyrhizobium sp. CCGUVB23]